MGINYKPTYDERGKLKKGAGREWWRLLSTIVVMANQGTIKEALRSKVDDPGGLERVYFIGETPPNQEGYIIKEIRPKGGKGLERKY